MDEAKLKDLLCEFEIADVLRALASLCDDELAVERAVAERGFPEFVRPAAAGNVKCYERLSRLLKATAGKAARVEARIEL